MSTPQSLGPRRLKSLATAVALGATALAATAPAASAEVEPNRNLEVNTSIEFALAEGWPAGAQLRMEVFRGSTLVASAQGTGPSMEVNHLGDDCWDGVPAGRSPDIQGGDKIVLTNLSTPGDVDYMFVPQIQYTESGTTLTGTANGAEGPAGVFSLTPAAAGSMEAIRKVDPKQTVAITPGPTGAFTATLPGTGGEVTIDHVVGTGGGTATTTAEPGGPGASACGDRVTTSLTTNTHSIINQANVGQAMVVGGPRNEGAATTVSVSFGAQTYDAVEAGSGWTATIPATALAALANNANHVLTATFSDGAPAQSLTVRKDTEAPAAPSVNPTPGAYTTGQSVAFGGIEPGASVRYTVDGSTPTTTSTLYTSPIPVLSDRTIKAIQVDAAGNVSTLATFAYTIAPTVVVVEKQAPAQQQSNAQPQVQAPAPVVGGGQQQERQPSLAISASGLRVTGKLDRRSLRRSGLRYSVRLSSATRHLMVRLVRVQGRKRSVMQERVVRVSGGRYAGRVNLPRGLKAGSYRLEIAPAGADRQLVRGQGVAFRVR